MVYTIGDLHLSFGTAKPMDIFSGWEGYQEKIKKNWEAKIKPEDTVILAGDTSWGMSIAEAMPDFLWLDALPGKKLVLKGNHDYWWTSVSSMKRQLQEASVTSVDFLHNNSFLADGVWICGSRGWMFETGQAHDAKIINREAMRIEASLQAAGKESGEFKRLFLHYPPVYGDQEIGAFLELMHRYGIQRCYYGHIHGAGHRFAIDGLHQGIEFRLIAADYIAFDPVLVQ